MNVVLAEKPDQARKLASPFPHKKHKSYIEIHPCASFPQGAKIVWAIGHLVQLVAPEFYHPSWKKWNLRDLPIIPDSFKYEVIRSRSSHFKEVKKHLSSASQIIIATDPAREGELIARLIIHMSGAANKPIKRLWCSSLTESAIQTAFQNLRPGDSTKPYYYEALARSYSDWLVGINTSRVYTLLLQQKGIRSVFSTGRVQTPLLVLIRRREEEIERFKPEKYWELIGIFTTTTGELYTGKVDQRFSDEQKALAHLADLVGHPGTVVKVETEKKSTKPPKFHSLSTLQTKMNRRYKYSPSRVLEIVQSLYEKGYVSYPRTDSQYVTKAEAAAFPTILNKLKPWFPVPNQPKDITLNKRYVNDAKVTDHYAIIPTDQVPKPDQFGRDEQRIYDEIARSLIAAHSDDYIYNETQIITDVKGTAFYTVGRQPLHLGWKNVFQEKSEEEKKEEQTNLPALTEGETVSSDIQLKDGMTQPPKPYTEGQLIQLMKTAGRYMEDDDLSDMKNIGLGTEATRAGMIQTLKDREYILVEKNIVRVTEKGKLLVQVVEGTPLAKPDLTAKWEEFLHQIGRGEKSHIPFIERSKELAQRLVEDAKRRSTEWNITWKESQPEQQQGIGFCPKCKKTVVEKQSFYGCTGYKDGCKFTLPKQYLGKKISVTNVKKLLEKGRSNLMKGFKSKNRNTFDGYLVLQDHKLSIEFHNAQRK